MTDHWLSPTTGADYPAGWTVRIPGDDLTIDLAPTVADQELDTRATTGVIYWEGSQRVHATRHGIPLGGEGYVELTGYAASATGAPDRCRGRTHSAPAATTGRAGRPAAARG